MSSNPISWYCRAFIVFLGTLFSASAMAQTSPWYVTGKDLDTGLTNIYVIQSGTIVESWTLSNNNPPANGWHEGEFPIIVLDGFARTTGSVDGFEGGEYNLDGTHSSVSYPYPNPAITYFADATTDGKYIYAPSSLDNRCFRYDLDWSNPQMIFTGAFDSHGVTFDPTSNSLFFDNTYHGLVAIEQRSLSGAWMSEFILFNVIGDVVCLGRDPADGTLWFADSGDFQSGTRRFHNYTTDGTEVGSFTLAELNNVYLLGGEFEFMVDPNLVVSADSVSVVLGNHVDGDLADLAYSDDENLKYSNGAPFSPTAPSIWLDFTGTLPVDEASALKLKVECNVSDAGILQSISVFDFNNGSYEEVDVRPATRNLDSVSHINLTGDINRFIEPGTGLVKARVTYTENGVGFLLNWNACIDQLVWEFD